MSAPIHILRRDVPSFLREGYKGRKFRVEVCLEMTVPMTAGLWSGGTRDSYKICRLRDGVSLDWPGQMSSPFCKGREDRKVQMSTEYVVIKESVFCGKHAGLTYYVHPDTVRAGYFLPPQAAELARSA